MMRKISRRAALISVGSAGIASAADPIRIGFAEALTGSLAAVGKSGILAMNIWVEQGNARGGLPGRPVSLVYYGNQSNPANVPGLYVKLLDVDKVDVIMSGYSTNMTAPAMPVVISHDKMFLSLFARAAYPARHRRHIARRQRNGPDRAIIRRKPGRIANRRAENPVGTGSPSPRDGDGVVFQFEIRPPPPPGPVPAELFKQKHDR